MECGHNRRLLTEDNFSNAPTVISGTKYFQKCFLNGKFV